MSKYISPATRRKRFKIWAISVPSVVLVVVVLVLGLYFGLHHHSDNTSGSSSSSSSSGSISTSTPTLTATSTLSQTATSTPSQTGTATSTSTSTPTSTPGGNTTINSTNPVQFAAVPKFLGNVTSTNTPDVRDGGWQGNIGNTWINTYADTEPCQKKYGIDCSGLIASNSASTATNSPNNFTDINPSSSGHAQAFCAELSSEGVGIAIWLSNVVQVGKNSGIVYYIRLNRENTSDQYVMGSGVATISTAGSMPVCNRTTLQWWGQTEPFWGDHNAVVGPDGYIYVFGSSPTDSSSLHVARVKQASGNDMSSYQYWNGEAYTSSRLYNPTSDSAVLSAGQGSVVYSPFYEKYLYFLPGCYAGTCIFVQAADQPQGPWSNTTTVYTSGDNPYGFEMYAPAVQPKYSDSQMSFLVLTFVGQSDVVADVLQAINVTFVK